MRCAEYTKTVGVVVTEIIEMKSVAEALVVQFIKAMSICALSWLGVL